MDVHGLVILTISQRPAGVVASMSTAAVRAPSVIDNHGILHWAAVLKVQ